MKIISYEKIVEAVSHLCGQCGFELPNDVILAIKEACQRETNSLAKEILWQLLENADAAAGENVPLCQDTGLVVVFVELGSNVHIEPPKDKLSATLTDAIQDGVKHGYTNNLLRMSMVHDPLNQRLNTQSNTPAVVHLEIIPGDVLKISVMAKGGGCENKSRFNMFNPTESEESVRNWIVGVVKEAGANACPPFVVGIGLGGNFEKSCFLSKKALLRTIGQMHPDDYYARMEMDILAAVNATGLGPQGLGGDTTALAVCIETAPCHIASLPVAVNIECHSHRHKSIVL